MSRIIHLKVLGRMQTVSIVIFDAFVSQKGGFSALHVAIEQIDYMLLALQAS